MEMVRQRKSGGFVKLVIILLAVLIVLGYFGFNIQNILNSPTVSNNLNYAWSLVLSVWNRFLVGPANFIWNKIIIGMMWEPLQSMVNKSYKAPTIMVPAVPAN